MVVESQGICDFHRIQRLQLRDAKGTYLNFAAFADQSPAITDLKHAALLIERVGVY